MPETTYLQLLNLTHFSSQCVRNYSFQIFFEGGGRQNDWIPQTWEPLVHLIEEIKRGYNCII